MKKKLLVLITLISAVCLICLTVCSCTTNKTGEAPLVNGGADTGGSSGSATQSQKLQIVKSEYKFTPEQAMSQLKAEYLIENGGYKDDDKVVVVAALKNDSLIELYNDRYSDSYATVSEFASGIEGEKQNAKILSEQEAFVARLKEKGVSADIKYSYSAIINAVAIEIEYKDLKKVEKTEGVEYTILSDTFNLPKSVASDASTITNAVEIYPTGIYDSSSAIDKNGNKITGKGTAVAVLDSGFDCSHSVFSRMPDCTDDELLLVESDVQSFLDTPGNNASKFTSGLKLSQVYLNAKIPYAYDYADKDPDVMPYDSEHGTHVAGIIAGFDDVITGIAVDTQLVLMKVFPDHDDGGKTEDILCALEDAVLLNVDAINMSLGSSCGFSREEDNDRLNRVYTAIGQAGIGLITAASNDYSAGFGGAEGNTNKVTNPDSGTVGSPSTYASSLSVASISGTKSRYVVANGSQVFFFKESNSISGDENDFYAELYESLRKKGYTEEQLKGEITLDYVTVPGVGSKINFDSLGNISGKIALVKRGDITFEEKAMNAKNAGAIACIIYNNIDGDILMSMGKTEHIPTVSISRTDGAQLAKVKSGKMAFHFTEYMAGPFMSDFSSWGPTADLKLKPEITAHGGNILSAVPNGRYDEMSGTSMATPNLCGIMILIRSYLKDKYPSYTWSEINSLANQLLMSTATIIRNEEGNPYSPRKQGAGLASMRNVVSAEAYLSVDGSDRPKLELGDDKNRTGVYDMQFNVVNFSDRELTYRFDFVGMTETVSASDETFVAETPYILSGNTVLEVNGAYSDGTITVGAGQTATLKVTYTLSNADKQYIEERFPYGMYVEGFAKLLPTYDDGVQLNIPFLAFYGDWTEAPLFDKTYYEVEEEAHNNAIDDEDKLKADYYATTPYGSYYYNYIIPLGTYLYDIDPEKYDAIPASREHIAISNFLGTIDGIGSVYAGLLRNAKTMTFTITDKVTGEVVFETVDYNATKAHSYGGSPIPYYDLDKISAYKTGLVNNREYEFKMVGKLDYGDGGLETNMRNAFSFDFFMDNEAPVLKEVSYEKIYDKSLKKDRFYLTMTIYDNHYVQSITPIVFTSSSSYTLLTKTPIPVYSERGTDNTVRFEITDFLDDAFNDGLITSGLAFSIDDYALNSNIYVCQLPGTDGEFKFTKNGETDGTDLIILSVNEGDVVDLTRYLATTDESLDADKDYLNHLAWSSSNEKVVKVNRGSIVAIKEGRATVSVKEQMDLRQAVIIINVKPKDSANAADTPADDDVDGARIKEARFTYFDTLFAYSRAAQTSEIHSTGSRVFINSLSGINFYPGEKIKLSYEMKPWYVTDKYDVTFKSTNPAVATVDEEGVVTGLKEGSTTISLSIAGSNIVPTVRVTIKNPFVIENRTLIAYKGLGGNVVIPDDEGILYVGAFAFCLYDTDYSIEVSEEDYDKNKIPASNTTVTSVVIPDGVQEIQKYAFYNCTGLREVAIPNDVKFIRDYAFYNCAKLERVVYNGELVTDPAAKTYADRYVYSDGKFTFKSGSAPTSLTGTKAEVIGQNAFAKCVSLDNFDFSNVYAIGMRAFDGCTSLSYADLTALRNAEKEVFRGCSSLERAVLDEDTKLSYAMFVRSGLTSVDVYNIDVDLPAYIFAQCPSLTEINIRNGLVSVGKGAFSECDSLVSVNFEKGVGTIGELAFYNSKNLASVKLPEGRVKVEINAFRGCEGLTVLEFGETTEIVGITGALFKESGITSFVVDVGNPYYKAEGGLLLSANGKKIVFAGAGNEYGAYTVDAKYDEIGDSAFAGTDITELTIINKDIKIGSYAFAECSALTKVIFPAEAGLLSVGESAFNGDIALVTVENLGYVTSVGQLAFAGTGITEATVAENAVYGNGAFMASALETVTIGKNARFGLSAFRENRKLTTVNMPAEGNVTFGAMCFAGDVKLETIDLSKTDGIIASETFYGCSKLRTVNLTGVEVVGDYAFADCRNLSDLTITEGLTEIGEGAFSRNTENGGAPCFTEIYLPSTLVKIGVGAFIGCRYLTDVVLPDSLGEESNEYAFGKPVADDRDFRYGDSLFMYCESLRSVTLPAGAEAIGMYAFYGCAKLTTINNVGSVKTIDDYAFAACSQLASFDFSSVVTVGEGAFAKSALGGYVYAAALKEVEGYAFQNTSFVYFNAPALEKIGEAAFQLNPKLKQFELSENVSEIGLMPFYGCTALEKFLCDGSEDGEVNEYAKIVDGVLYTRMKSGKFQLHSVPAAKKTSILEVEEGTYRIETYAGNENDNIAYVVLPDSLRLIGNYAFYGCDGLTTVEFKSVRAPRLEDSYNQYISLNENDPGYELIHNVFDIFGLELYYCNFIDVLGKKEPINMVLPANKDITGYDGIAYEGYFGKVSSSRRSDYVAMEEELIDFIDYAEKIVAKSVVTLADEALVNDALTAYKALTQEGTDYGYGREEWFLMIGAVNEAKNRITELKIRTATYKAQQIQKEIYALPAVFTVDKLTTLKNLSERINALDLRDKNILDMSRYNAFVASYEEYRKAIEEEAKLFGSIGGYKTNEQ